jgi:hypothetical protein
MATRGRHPGGQGTDLVARAQAAWDRAHNGPGAPPYSLPVQYGRRGDPTRGPFIRLSENTVQVKGTDAGWVPFEPQQDGRPMLAGRAVYRAQLGDSVLALDVARSGERKLVLFRGPHGAALGELSDVTPAGPFALSADGKHLAYGRGRGELVVRDVGQRLPVTVATRGRLHDNLSVALDDPPLHLVVRVRSFEHTFRVTGGRLAHAFRKGVDHREQWHPPTDQLPTAYDPHRFRPGKVVGAGRWRAAVDRLGQVVLFTRDGTLVLSVLIRRDKAAVWIPGEVFWGAPELIGGPPTPDAEGKIGKAILAAGEQ